MPKGHTLQSSKVLRQRISEFIIDYTMDYDIAPTLSEIALELHTTAPLIHYHLCKMYKAGLVTWQYGKHRTLEVL